MNTPKVAYQGVQIDLGPCGALSRFHAVKDTRKSTDYADYTD
jgi:hypothetical protein